MSTAPQNYVYIQVNGPISIVPVTPKEVENRRLDIYILMGPTGSGKSSFIESLAQHQHLNISKDSLESVTQEVNCYQVVNLGTQPNYGDWMFVLMDTPGFLDPRMSEGRITRMITERLDAFRSYDNDIAVFILYFQPITDIRIGGSKRHSFKMLREYVNLYKARYLTVITTMWNTLSTTRQLEDANHRFERLQNGIYKSSNDLGIDVTKFGTLSKDSALSSLDITNGSWPHSEHSENIKVDHQYQSLLCDNLLSRITGLLQQLQMIAEDKWTATCPGSEDRCLLEVVLRDEKVALASLQSFLDDLLAINPPQLTSESWEEASIFHIDRSGLTPESLDLATDDIGPSGIMALQCLLDALYDQDCDACSSPWPLSRALPLAPLLLLPADPPRSIVALDIPSDRDPAQVSPWQVPGLDRLSITPAPIPSAPQGQPPSPDVSCFAPIAAAIKRRFNRARR